MRQGIRAGIIALLLWPFVDAPLRATSGRPVTFEAADSTRLSALLYDASRTAPVVVLVHMLGRSKDEWAPVAERLRDTGLSALALDLRGHGQSFGNGSELALMTTDVIAAVRWAMSGSELQPPSVAIVGASLGANLAALAAGTLPEVRAVALLSPSLDYRGVRLDAGAMRKLATRAVWSAASAEDPYALRSIKELTTHVPTVDQRISTVRGHGTLLLNADADLARELVDWLRARLAF